MNNEWLLIIIFAQQCIRAAAVAILFCWLRLLARFSFSCNEAPQVWTESCSGVCWCHSVQFFSRCAFLKIELIWHFGHLKRCHSQTKPLFLIHFPVFRIPAFSFPCPALKHQSRTNQAFQIPSFSAPDLATRTDQLVHPFFWLGWDKATSQAILRCGRRNHWHWATPQRWWADPYLWRKHKVIIDHHRIISKSIISLHWLSPHHFISCPIAKAWTK